MHGRQIISFITYNPAVVYLNFIHLLTLYFEVKYLWVNKASLLGFRKTIYKMGKYISQKINYIMVFSTIKIRCNMISGVKDSGTVTDILHILILLEPPGYMIKIRLIIVLSQNVTEEAIEYIEFHIRDGHGRSIYVNDDVLNLNLHLV